MNFAEVLARDASELIDRATETVLDVRLKHYAAAGRPALRGHIEDLFGCLLACIDARNPTPMIEHAQAIAAARFATGFGLHEVQTAINVIEEAVWLRLQAELPPEQFAEAIRIVSSILGMGKDTFATSYVHLAAHAHAPAVDLSALFRGTDGV